MAWCEQTMTVLGHPSQATTAEFFIPGSGDAVPPWYRDLVYAARAHQATGSEPTLGLAERPFVEHRKGLVKEICQAMHLDPSEWPMREEEE